MNAAGSAVQMAYAKEYENNPNSLIISIPSGQLPCKRIFFFKWRPDIDEEVLQQSIVDFIWNIMQNVVSYKFTSIAFPAIGCGQHDCSKNIVVRTMVKEIKNQLKMRNLPLIVRFVVQPGQAEIYDEFCKQVLSSEEGKAKDLSYFFSI
jgi:O-acetyl-ADP-ribose deacetylase (regulator of RNase III)